MGGTRIGQVAIKVSDIASSKPFYRDLLGLTHLFDSGAVSAFAAGDATLLLIEEPGCGGDASHGMAVYFSAAPIEQRFEALTAAGSAGSVAPHVVGSTPDADVLIAFVTDPSGNQIGLIEHRPLAAT